MLTDPDVYGATVPRMELRLTKYIITLKHSFIRKKNLLEMWMSGLVVK